MPSRAQISSTRATSAALPGSTTASGASSSLPGAKPDQVGVAAPGGAPHAVLATVQHRRRPDGVGDLGRERPRRAA